MNETLGNEVVLLRARVAELESALAYRWDCQQTLERIVDLLRHDLAEARANVIEDTIRWFMEHISGSIASKAAFCDEIRRALAAAAPCSATGPFSAPDTVVPQEARRVEPAPELGWPCPDCHGRGHFNDRDIGRCSRCNGTGMRP